MDLKSKLAFRWQGRLRCLRKLYPLLPDILGAASTQLQINSAARAKRARRVKDQPNNNSNQSLCSLFLVPCEAQKHSGLGVDCRRVMFTSEVRRGARMGKGPDFELNSIVSEIFYRQLTAFDRILRPQPVTNVRRDKYAAWPAVNRKRSDHDLQYRKGQIGCAFG
jgi:hypothetical protein